MECLSSEESLIYPTHRIRHWTRSILDRLLAYVGRAVLPYSSRAGFLWGSRTCRTLSPSILSTCVYSASHLRRKHPVSGGDRPTSGYGSGTGSGKTESTGLPGCSASGPDVTISEFTKKAFCTEALLRRGCNEFVPKPWELMAHSPFSYSIDAITSAFAYFVSISAGTASPSI